MKKRTCPSCKKKIADNVKKCPKCGSTIPPKTNASVFSAKAAIILAVIIIAVIAVYMQNQTSEHEMRELHNEETGLVSMDSLSGDILSADALSEDDPVEIIQAETLKDINGAEYTSSDVVLEFNSFMKNENADSLSINDLVLESANEEDIYREIKDNISIFIVTPKDRSAVTSVFVRAESSGNNDKPTEFITYCFALMNTFNPTMNAHVRQDVLFRMMGYSVSEDVPLIEENTYIIAETKYTFKHSQQNGLSMLIEQMPKLEVYSGDIPIR